MTRLWIMSDLHLETQRRLPLRDRFTPSTILEHDVVVLAGDVHWSPEESIRWSMEHFQKPVIYVAGNHEMYGSSIQSRISGGRRVAAEFPDDVHFLEDASVVVAGVRFLGATLWTDFMLHGSSHTDVAYAMRDAVRGSQDFSLIQGFQPQDAALRHHCSRAFLEAELATPFDGPTVVVTHHAPSPRSIADQWKGATTSPAYASDLTALIERHQPALWVHGHVHDGFDYTIGRTRVICNPRGFSDERGEFNPSLVVEV